MNIAENQLEYNVINIIRHLAAILVIFSHSFVLCQAGGMEPLHRFTNVFDLSEIAVFVFFALSGRLIYNSCLRSSSLIVFFKRRLLRIVPALFVCVIFTLLVSVFFLPEGVTISEYAVDFKTIKYFCNVLFVGDYSLPYIFDNNPYPYIANGSLWTLRYELIMYLLTPLVALCNHKKAISISLAIAFLLGWCFLFNYEKSFLQNISKLGFVYFISVFVCTVNFNVRIKHISLMFFLMFALVFLGFALAAKIFLVLNVVFLLQFLYSELFSSSLFIQNKISFDLSYGLYIYAFFTQQIIILIAEPKSAYFVFYVSISITILLASLSWLLVEKPFLKFK